MHKLSVIIPNYNHGNYLPEVIKSCLEEDNLVHEIIIVDDASTDNSLEVLEELQKNYHQLKVFSLNKNSGVPGALNQGILKATGDWLLFRAADDLCAPNSIGHFFSILKENHNISMVTGDVGYFYNKTDNLIHEKQGVSNETVLINENNFKTHYAGCIIHGVSTFCKRTSVIQAGMFNPELYWHCDWFLLTKLALTSNFIYTPHMLGYMRINPYSYNASGTERKDIQNQIYNKIIEEFIKDTNLLKKALKTDILNFFGKHIIPAILNLPADIKKQFKLFIESEINSNTYQKQIGHYYVIRNFINNHYHYLKRQNKIALYGAGNHTRQLLSVWDEFSSLARPCTIIETTSNIKYFDNIPVVTLKEFSSKHFDCVIISSKSYEPLLAANIKQFHPEIDCLKIWEKNLLKIHKLNTTT